MGRSLCAWKKGSRAPALQRKKRALKNRYYKKEGRGGIGPSGILWNVENGYLRRPSTLASWGRRRAACNQALSVPVDVSLRDLAFERRATVMPEMVKLLPCRRNPVELAFVITAARPAGHDRFAFGNDILNRQVKVGKGRAVESRSLLFTLGTAPKSGVEGS